MAMRLEANINILWQNLIALNASLIKENEERGSELLATKKLLEKEIENSKALHAKNQMQECELLKKNQKIARFSSKMVAVREIISRDFEGDDNCNNDATTSPIIVKVETVDSDIDISVPVDDNDLVTPLLSINVCGECDRKFTTSKGLKNHITVLHTAPSFPCPICSLKFFRTDYVRRHIKRDHYGQTKRRQSLRHVHKN